MEQTNTGLVVFGTPEGTADGYLHVEKVTPPETPDDPSDDFYRMTLYPNTGWEWD